MTWLWVAWVGPGTRGRSRAFSLGYRCLTTCSLGFASGQNMRFQQRLNVQNGRSRGLPVAGSRTILSQLIEDRPVQDFFDVAQPAGDVGAVEHSVVVDQLDDHSPGERVDRSVGERGRQR